jgi:hypothetical protein
MIRVKAYLRLNKWELFYIKIGLIALAARNKQLLSAKIIRFTV